LFSEISSLTPAFLPLFGNGLSFRISAIQSQQAAFYGSPDISLVSLYL
jgi:hypothetical protein